jgi:uncharacterized protein (TIGR03083 family)
MTTTLVESIRPITRKTDGRDVALAVYESMIAFIESLDSSDWMKQTECPAWTVEDMLGHVIGNAKASASKRELLRLAMWGLRHKGEFDGNAMDAYNALQVAEHRDLTPAQRVKALREIAPRAVDGRFRTSGLLRATAGPVSQSGSTAGFQRWLSMGHLMDVIYSRDTWMHRVDIARATGRDLPLAAVDIRIVEDAVREWIGRHQQPVDLNLTGPAGGHFVHGSGGVEIEMDAIEFCRVLSGRGQGEGLLEYKILF